MDIEYESQCGQDKFLIQKVFKRKKGGFYVDVGAHDGVYISNTRAFEIGLGWSGICVEPSSASSNMVNLRNCKVVVACVGDESHDNKIVKLRQRNPLEVSQTLFDAEKYEHKQGEYQDKFKICKTLNRILLENSAPKDIDYISIDVEGTEYMIVKDFPFDDWNVTAMSIANNLYQDTKERIENRKKIKKLLEDGGYILMKEFTLHELDKKNWGKKFDDEVMEDLYVSEEFFKKKKLKIA